MSVLFWGIVGSLLLKVVILYTRTNCCLPMPCCSNIHKLLAEEEEEEEAAHWVVMIVVQFDLFSLLLRSMQIPVKFQCHKSSTSKSALQQQRTTLQHKKKIVYEPPIFFPKNGCMHLAVEDYNMFPLMKEMLRNRKTLFKTLQLCRDVI